ncbi:hypothetical protein AYX14_06165 [Cryptococcus neoformans]|nr:hypothetical protein AYX14_06165 [Cryptococcus neoformans var. grubii]
MTPLQTPSIPTPPNPPLSPQPAAPSGKPSPIQHQPPPYSASIIVKEDSTVSTSQPTRLKAPNSQNSMVAMVMILSTGDILRLLDSLLHSNTFYYYVCLSEKEHYSFNTWNAWSKCWEDGSEVEIEKYRKEAMMSDQVTDGVLTD